MQQVFSSASCKRPCSGFRWAPSIQAGIFLLVACTRAEAHIGCGIASLRLYPMKYLQEKGVGGHLCIVWSNFVVIVVQHPKSSHMYEIRSQ